MDIYTYVTENTFDSYLFQLVEQKQKFIGQIMTGKSPMRSAEDIDEQALSYAEIKALASGNPLIKEKMDLEIEVQKLKLLRNSHMNQKFALQKKISKELPEEISFCRQRIAGCEKDIQHLKNNAVSSKDDFSPMEINGIVYTDKKSAGAALLNVCKMSESHEAVYIGSYRGFKMELNIERFTHKYSITLKNSLRYTTELGTDLYGNIQRIDNLLNSLPERKIRFEKMLDNNITQLENAKKESEAQFPHEEKYNQALKRLEELNRIFSSSDEKPEIPAAENEHYREVKI